MRRVNLGGQRAHAQFRQAVDQVHQSNIKVVTTNRKIAHINDHQLAVLLHDVAGVQVKVHAGVCIGNHFKTP